MPDVTDRLTPTELAAILRRCERFEKALHDGNEHEFTVAAAASAVDVRPLLAEVEAARRDVDDLRAGALNRLVALVPSGLARNLVAAVVAEVERELAPIGAREGKGNDG